MPRCDRQIAPGLNDEGTIHQLHRPIRANGNTYICLRWLHETGVQHPHTPPHDFICPFPCCSRCRCINVAGEVEFPVGHCQISQVATPFSRRCLQHVRFSPRSVPFVSILLRSEGRFVLIQLISSDQHATRNDSGRSPLSPSGTRSSQRKNTCLSGTVISPDFS